MAATIQVRHTDGQGLLPRLVVWLDGQSPTQLLISAGIMVAGLAVLSTAVGSELALAVFYLAPISVAAYFVGRSQGRWVAVLCGMSWTVVGEALIPTSTPTIMLAWSALSRVLLFLVVAELLSSLRIAFDHERQLARTDALTGAANARAFEEHAEQEMLRARRYRRPFTMVHLDLDGFKMVNDTQGHAAGDRVLQTVTRGLRSTLRRTDLIARLGGDEFAVLLPETGEDVADLVLGKIRTGLEEAMQSGGWNVSASFGAVTTLTIPKTLDLLMAKADELTYRSKRAGKNRISHESVTTWGPADAATLPTHEVIP